MCILFNNYNTYYYIRIHVPPWYHTQLQVYMHCKMIDRHNPSIYDIVHVKSIIIIKYITITLKSMHLADIIPLNQTVCYKQESVISEQFPTRYCSTWSRSIIELL